MHGVTDVRLAELAKQLQSRHDIDLQFSDDAVAWLAATGFDSVYGARPLRRLLHRVILSPLSRQLLDGSLSPGKGVRVELASPAALDIEAALATSAEDAVPQTLVLSQF